MTPHQAHDQFLSQNMGRHWTRQEMLAHVARTCGLPSTQAAGDALLQDERHEPGNEQASATPAPDTADLRRQWDASATLRAEFADNFSTFKAYKEAVAAGLVRMSGSRG